MEKNNKININNSTTTLENFEGIRKTNARTIFGVLMVVLIIDFVYDLVV